MTTFVNWAELAKFLHPDIEGEESLTNARASVAILVEAKTELGIARTLVMTALSDADLALYRREAALQKAVEERQEADK
ncbi:MAG: hypothetical protein GY702_22665 [Desulfobulbaceae bacterium]|nr:hypothetical protein [Desulfobulbaceae bacterium]